MNICKCGCNLECKNMWIRGHCNKGIVRSEEAKQRLSESLKGRTFSEEAKQKMSESSIGKNKGKTHSNEFKQRLSEVNKGQIRSEETRKKMSEGSIGRVHSEETRKKISEGNKGRKPTSPYGRSKWIPYTELDLSISKMPTYEYHTRVYLDSIGESYIWCAKGNYKEHIIRLSNGTAYYPDFYLPNHKVYLDPKGFWQDLEKKALIEAEYPNQCYHFLGDTYLQQIKDFIQEKYTVIV